MGVRGSDEVLAALPQVASGSAAAVMEGLADLLSVRHAALAPEGLRALGEFWERLCAQASAGRLGVFAAMDARDDIVPKAPVGQASNVFAQQRLGQRRSVARRDAEWARLLRPEVGDLPLMGAAFARGEISGAHVEVAVRVHRQLGAAVREKVVECKTPLGDTSAPGTPDASDEALATALTGLSGVFTEQVRQILVVDCLLLHYALRMSVAELDAVGRRIVETLNPPSPAGAHERRFLHMSQLPGGAWVGRFECGPAQGLFIKRAVAAWSAPRPGVAIDADGVEHKVPDLRDLGARQVDALNDLVAVALAKDPVPMPVTLPVRRPPTSPEAPQAEAGPESAGAAAPRGEGPAASDEPRGAQNQGAPTDSEHRDERASVGRGPRDDCLPFEDPGAGTASWQDLGEPDATFEESEPPDGEGELVVVREPGVLVGPYPTVDLVLVAGIEHVAAAWAKRPEGLPLDPEGAFREWLRDRVRGRNPASGGHPPTPSASQPHSEPAAQPPVESPVESPEAPWGASWGASGGAASGAPSGASSGAPSGASSRAQSGAPPGAGGEDNGPRPDGGWGEDLAWIGRALSPYAVPARLEHAGSVDATTLELLACNATVRAAVLAPNGALLDLGRTQRLATPAQKSALIARDGSCVIPGCTVPGDASDAHHVIWWSRGGPTDLDNLALLCGRHHDEVHHGEWEIHMRDGVPWVAPPSWIDPFRPLLRNGVHHPAVVPRGIPEC